MRILGKTIDLRIVAILAILGYVLYIYLVPNKEGMENAGSILGKVFIGVFVTGVILLIIRQLFVGGDTGGSFIYPT